MQQLLRGHRWLAGLLLAGACRSEQAAYSFRSAPVAGSVAPVPTVTAAAPETAPPAAGARVVSVRPAFGQPTAPTHQLVRFRHSTSPPRARELAGRHLRLAETTARPTRPARLADTRDTLHLVLGAVLVVAGVVTGLALGGWLGLGVGAAGVLLGYYFLLMGLGGRQAWLEVFQEFFNM